MHCLNPEYTFECCICECISKEGYIFSKEGCSERAIPICYRCFSEMKHSAEILKSKSDKNNNNC